MRHKPMYNNLRLTYIDGDGVEWPFFANEITANKNIINLIGQPMKDSGRRYITDSDIEFEIDCVIVHGEELHRITEQPEIKPVNNNNSRRGYERKVKLIVTT